MIWKEDISVVQLFVHAKDGTLQQLMNEGCVQHRKEVSDSLLPPQQGRYLPPPASPGTYGNIQTLN